MRRDAATVWHGKVARLGRASGAVQARLQLWGEYWAFRRRYGRLFGEQIEGGRPPKRLLVVSLSDWVLQVKQESVLAKALQFKGYAPVFLTSRRYRAAVKYHRLFGYREVVFFEDYLRGVSSSGFDAQVEALLGQRLSFQAIKRFTFRGVAVGRHVLATIARSFHVGRIEADDPQLAASLRRLLPEAMRAVAAVERLLAHVRPAAVLMNEKGYVVSGEIYEVALQQGLDVIQWVSAHRDDHLIFKRYTPETKALHPISISPRTWGAIKGTVWDAACEHALGEELRERYADGSWFSRLHAQDGKPLKTKEDVQRGLGLDPSKKTAVIFAHILWDATFFYGEDLFDDYEEWLVETVRAACANPSVNWIIKLHPATTFKLKKDRATAVEDELTILHRRAGPLPSHVKVLGADAEIKTSSLFGWIDYCLTVRGTIGIEMACFGTPVLTAGTGRYSGLGFTVDSQGPKEYLQRLARIQDLPRLSPEQTRWAKVYAHTLFRLRPWRWDTCTTVHQAGAQPSGPLERNLVIHAASLEDLRRAEDLRAFAQWVATTTDEDFLAQCPTGAAGADGRLLDEVHASVG